VDHAVEGVLEALDGVARIAVADLRSVGQAKSDLVDPGLRNPPHRHAVLPDAEPAVAQGSHEAPDRSAPVPAREGQQLLGLDPRPLRQLLEGARHQRQRRLQRPEQPRVAQRDPDRLNRLRAQRLRPVGQGLGIEVHPDLEGPGAPQGVEVTHPGLSRQEPQGVLEVHLPGNGHREPEVVAVIAEIVVGHRRVRIHDLDGPIEL
jgi:hypothetical protein